MAYRSVFQPDLFAGQTIVITGGGSGIGRCHAHELASLGAHVCLLGRKQEKLDKVHGEIAEVGGASSCYSLDIREEDQVTDVVARIVADHGVIHGLVNNAGGQFPASLKDISKNGFETVVRTNLTGGFLVSREVYKQSMAEHGGAIVNIVADMWGGMPRMGHSGAARAGMVNLTQTMAVEWAASGVRCNAVAPGWIASSGLDTYKDPIILAAFPHMKKRVPLKRVAEEAEVSAAMTFLLSPAAAFITGVCLPVDGGAPLNDRLFYLADHERSEPYQGFHLAEKPKAIGD